MISWTFTIRPRRLIKQQYFPLKSLFSQFVSMTVCKCYKLLLLFQFKLFALSHLLTAGLANTFATPVFHAISLSLYYFHLNPFLSYSYLSPCVAIFPSLHTVRWHDHNTFQWRILLYTRRFYYSWERERKVGRLYRWDKGMDLLRFYTNLTLLNLCFISKKVYTT